MILSAAGGVPYFANTTGPTRKLLSASKDGHGWTMDHYSEMVRSTSGYVRIPDWVHDT